MSSNKVTKWNPVAKYAREYNKAKVERDRKKTVKRGYRKHKRKYDGIDGEG